MKAGADILEFDIRLTKDKIPVLTHDFHTLRTHRDTSIISRLTLAELLARTESEPIVPLRTVLDEFFGKILLNIEIKGRGTAEVLMEILKKEYIKKPSDWDALLFSSFRGKELSSVRKASKKANLALLHTENPFIFVAYHRLLRLTGVGFHRLYVNRLALEIARKAGLFTYAYTVNRPKAATILASKGIDGVVTNYPDSILSDLKKKE
jgi:glycerophosphoryl diester phosphodiesterase